MQYFFKANGERIDLRTIKGHFDYKWERDREARKQAAVVVNTEGGLKKALNILNKKMPTVLVTCYGTTDLMDKVEAMATFKKAIHGSEGAEQARYVMLLSQIMEGKTVVSDEQF